jgi:hypothetical protein
LVNAKEQYYYEVAGDIPEEYDYLEKIRSERYRLQADCEKIVEAMYSVKATIKPKPYTLGYVKLQCDAKYFAQSYYKELKPYAKAVDAFLSGDIQPMLSAVMSAMADTYTKEDNYRSYNIQALAKRRRKNAGQEEIDRVQALIDDGTKKINHLVPRIEWLNGQIGAINTRP